MDPIAEGADRICDALVSDKPVFIGRNGSTEMAAVAFWNKYRNTSAPNKAGVRSWEPSILRNLYCGVGIWPETVEAADAWAKEYVESLKALDGVAAGWYEPFRAEESILLTTYAPDAFRMPLRSLEPYYVEPLLQWTQMMAGKRVAVISSFAQTIEQQTYKTGIWADSKTILPPTTTWIPIRAYYPPKISMGGSTGWPAGINDWSSAADMLVEKVRMSGATVAIIGCGGLGMIVGGRLKQLGISAIIMGGAVQVLFGIKGARWQTHSIISKFWNDSWVWPAPSETPIGAFKIEGGCYWASQGSKPSTTPR